MATKATNNLFESLTELLKNIANNTAKWDKNTINATKNLANLGVTVVKLDTQLKDLRLRIKNEDKNREFELTKSRERNTAIQDEIKLRGRLKLEIEQEHGAQVRRNIRLRESFKGIEASFGQFQSFLGGLGFMQAGGLAFKTTASYAQSYNRYQELGEKMKELQPYMKNITAKQLAKKPLTRREQDMLKEYQEVTDEREDISEKISPILKNKQLKGLFDKLNPLVDWVKRNKTGIIISAASIGLLATTFKKLIDSSPLLQKMLELFGLSFNLFLRPFGDFIGFVLKPLAIGLLQTVMPFFKAVYPVLMELGQSIGVKLAKGDILGALFDLTDRITPMSVIEYIFGGMNAEENPEGAVGAGGLALTAGGLGALYGANKLGKYAFNKIGNIFRPSATTNPLSTGQQTLNQSTQKSGGLLGKITNLFKGKGLSTGLTAGIRGASIGARLSNPIGLALLATELFGAHAIKTFAPDHYKGIQDALSFMDTDFYDFRNLIGFGKEGTLIDYLTGNATTPEDEYQSWTEGNAPTASSVEQTESGFLIVMNIGTVEKDVDVKALADSVASEVEDRMKSNNKYLVGQ